MSIKRLRVTNTSGVAVSTKIVDADTGSEVHGVTELDIRFRPSEVVTARCVLGLVETELMTRPVFLVAHPRTGEMLQVTTLTLISGEVVQLTDLPQKEREPAGLFWLNGRPYWRDADGAEHGPYDTEGEAQEAHDPRWREAD